MFKNVRQLLLVGVVLLPQVACESPKTAEECTAEGSADCAYCEEIYNNESSETTPDCSEGGDFYDPEYAGYELEHTCSDGAALLEAYKEGWVNRGCGASN